VVASLISIYFTNVLNFLFSDRKKAGRSIITRFCPTSENRVAPVQSETLILPLSDRSRFLLDSTILLPKVQILSNHLPKVQTCPISLYYDFLSDAS
jgi:hypothetical protein